MQHRISRKMVLALGFAAFVAFVAGCKKQVASAPPAPPPAPAAQPTVTLNAAPSAVNPGQTVTLSWSSTSATDLDIEPGVGKVSPQGSTPVNPGESTTYTITATGAGGTATASARVDVNARNAAAPARPSGPPNVQELFEQNVRDAFFDLDKSDLRADAREALTKDAEFLRFLPAGTRVTRRTLRRARFNGVQPGTRPASRGSSEEFPDLAGNHVGSRGNNQLGQRAPLLRGA